MNKLPESFTFKPIDSIWQKSEYETIAANVMVILGRNGNTWRKLSWDEYKSERLEDGNFTESEKPIFNKVVDHCISAEIAKLVCKKWIEIYSEE